MSGSKNFKTCLTFCAYTVSTMSLAMNGGPDRHGVSVSSVLIGVSELANYDIIHGLRKVVYPVQQRLTRDS